MPCKQLNHSVASVLCCVLPNSSAPPPSKSLKCVCISQQSPPWKCNDYVFGNGLVQMATPRPNVHSWYNKALGVVFGQGILFICLFFCQNLGRSSVWVEDLIIGSVVTPKDQVSTGSSCIPFITVNSSYFTWKTFSSYNSRNKRLKLTDLESTNPMTQAEKNLYAKQTFIFALKIMVDFKVCRSAETFTNQLRVHCHHFISLRIFSQQ